MIAIVKKFEEIKESFGKYVIPSYSRFDIAFERGSGSWLEDVNGKRYLDMGIRRVPQLQARVGNGDVPANGQQDVPSVIARQAQPLFLQCGDIAGDGPRHGVLRSLQFRGRVRGMSLQYTDAKNRRQWGVDAQMKNPHQPVTQQPQFPSIPHRFRELTSHSFRPILCSSRSYAVCSTLVERLLHVISRRACGQP